MIPFTRWSTLAHTRDDTSSSAHLPTCSCLTITWLYNSGPSVISSYLTAQVASVAVASLALTFAAHAGLGEDTFNNNCGQYVLSTVLDGMSMNTVHSCGTLTASARDSRKTHTDLAWCPYWP